LLAHPFTLLPPAQATGGCKQTAQHLDHWLADDGRLVVVSQDVGRRILPAHVSLRRVAGKWSMVEALLIAAGVARGLAHLHSRGVCHGGLTPNAVRVDWMGAAVLCDVALPVESGVGRAGASPGHYVAGVGTHHAPELAALAYGGAAGAGGAGRWYTRESDVWSLGLVVHGLVAGLDPAEAEAGAWGPLWRRADDADGSGGATPHPFPPYTRPDWARLPADVPAGVVSLLARMLSGAPGERPSAEAVARELDSATSLARVHAAAGGAGAGAAGGAGAGKR
jgi:serine/threonine protein kinase